MNGEVIGSSPAFVVEQKLLQIEIATNDCHPYRIHVLSDIFGGIDAPRAPCQVCFDNGEFGFVGQHPKVVSLQIVFRNVVHAVLAGCGKTRFFCETPRHRGWRQITPPSNQRLTRITEQR